MDYNVRYNIDINGDKASKSLNDFQNTVQKTVPTIISSLEQLRKEIGKINSSFTSFKKLTGTEPKKIKFTIDNKVSKEIKSLQKQINSLKGKTVTVNTKVTQTETTGTRSKTTKIPKMASPLDKGNNRAARGFGDGVRGLFGLSDLMYSMGFPFPNMIGTASIGMGTMSIIKDMAEYENIMATANAILRRNDNDMATYNDRYSQMSKNIRQVGVDTKFTTTEVAGAAKYLAMAGMGIDDINNSIRPIADLAIIGDASLDQMADIVTNIQTAYGIASEKMPQIADILTSVTTSTNTTVLEMGEAFKFAAPMMSMAGVSFNEASSAIGLLGNAGLKATVAGTALRAMMVRLLAPTKKGLSVLKEYGISLYDVDKATKKVKLKTLYDIFSQLKAKDVSLPDMITIFDKIGGNAANNVFSELKKLPELIEKSINSVGLARATAEEKQNTIFGRWDKVTSQFTESGMQVFEAYTPAIKQGLDELIVMLKSPETLQAIRDISSGLLMIMQTVMKLFSFVSENWKVFGPLIVGRLITTRILSIVTALSDLKKAFGVAGAAARIFGTILGTSTLSTDVSGKIVQGGGILGALGGIPGLITIAVAALGMLAFKVYENGQKIKNTVAGIENEISAMLPGYGENNGEIFSKENENRKIFELHGVPTSFVSNEDKIGFIGSLGRKDAASTITTAYSLLSNLDPNSKTFSADVVDVITGLKQETDKYKVSIGVGKVAGKANVTRSGERDKDLYYNVFTGTYKSYTNPMLEFAQVKEAQDLLVDDLKKTNEYIGPFRDLIVERQRVLEEAIIPLLDGTTREESLRAIRLLSGGIELFQEGDSPITTKQKLDQMYRSINPLGSGIVSMITHPIMEDIMKWSPNYVLSDKEIKQEDPLKDFQSDKGGNGSYSGTGKSTGNTPKQIIINIDALMKNVTVNSDSPEDMESFKNKMAQALIDVVKDFEISYS